jgi:5-oxoprolinase (ATP-hydrolysing)
MGSEQDHWRIWSDTGGTFTDCVACGPAGEVRRAKVLSSSALRGLVDGSADGLVLRVREDWNAPADFVRDFRFTVLGDVDTGVEVASYDPGRGELVLQRPYPSMIVPGSAFEVRSREEAPVLAARLVTGTSAGDPLPPIAMRLATTRGTNALLERRGAEVALFVTRGFGDLLEIGTQQRPELFALRVRRPRPLYAAVVEVDGRLSADGRELSPLDPVTARAAADELVRAGIRSAAIALIHSYAHPAHEMQLERILLDTGIERVSRSSAIAPEIRMLNRARTAVVNAYLAPVVEDYVRDVSSGLGPAGPGSTLHLMTSTGGLVQPDGFHAKDALLSGPAGGVVGAARAGRAAGFDRVITFDMGGTSTDVARFDGDYDYVWEHEVGGIELLAPALAIETVAAGGGSICELGPNGLDVGPRSAGAQPGPACYGAGGPLTITDVNLLLGRLPAGRLAVPVLREPAVAGARALYGALQRRGDAAEFGPLPEVSVIPAEAGIGEREHVVELEPLLEGLVDIANERMADAIRGISLRKGYDPAGYALVAFGGAGGQHACGVAEKLGIATVVVPPDAGLLSAWGLGHAVVERFAMRQVLAPLAEVEHEVFSMLRDLEQEAVAAVEREGVAAADVVVRRRVANLRYVGQDSTLDLEYDPSAPDLAGSFVDRHLDTYGHAPAGRAVELESLRVIASSRLAPEMVAPVPDARITPANLHARVWLAGGWRDAGLFDRDNLRPADAFTGPCLIAESHGATLIPDEWSGVIDGSSAIVLSHSGQPAGDPGPALAPSPAAAAEASGRSTSHLDAAPGAVVEELFVSRFASLVSEMGDQLRRTALSTNVKERLDFSCALLDQGGELVANAPHIPVHLGAMGLCVRQVRDALPMAPGDVVVTNHPAYGGSHLPDVTVITAVHDRDGALLGYVASRAHHAEIGGTRPGSMPPDATTLAEEGVVIAPTYLARAGEWRWQEIRRILSDAPHPSRAVDENLADLAAQAAANHRGAGLLREMARAHGRDLVAHHMDALKARAERRIRDAIAALPPGRYEAVERLDDGAPLQVRIDIENGTASIDFSGTGDVHPGNLNATPAIVRSVVIYVLRLLIAEPLPLNEGLMKAVHLQIPRGMLNPDFSGDDTAAPAVVGGNTEVSQRLTDTMLKALRLAACSQGTMNNVLWGNTGFGYYETVAGGTGAGPAWDGESAVHSHMTNTRITDPELLEHRYPVRLERFAIRRGSGGAGEWRGGDGVVREITFLEPVSLSVLGQHRVERPYGMDGGEPGAAGRQTLIRRDGERVELGSIDAADAEPGDRLLLETPGGGGWGNPRA